MKVLVAYDGSSYADIAIDDLRWAGLPAVAEALVLSVVEWPLQAPRSWGMVDTGFAEDLEHHIKAAERLAEQGCLGLQRYFPEWKLQAAVSPAGHASTAILDKAHEWEADLIVAGTHGRSALARVVLGSVSLKLVQQAHCSVRIARPHRVDGSIRILIGDDGSSEAEAALAEVCRRNWAKGTEVRVAAVHELLVRTNVEGLALDPNLYDRINEDEHFRLKQIVKEAAGKCDLSGMRAMGIVGEGDPKEVLVREARNWNASAIFVGARGMSRVERVLLGSVSSSAVAHAPCSVEVVRAR